MKMMLICFVAIGVLLGCSNETTLEENWEESSTFSLPVTFGDGTKGDYIFIGEKEKIAIQIGSGVEGEVVTRPIIAGEPHKYMWYFWGEQDEIRGKLKVVGINENGEEHKVLLIDRQKVWEYPPIGINPLNGADTHTPSGMEFPTPGLWKLEVHIGDNFFGDIIVNVEERFEN
ncbi:DUF4871 domain-containing protein [Alkalihalobacillus sp. LMS39]|uniref:DUF4871 domain-containing protein n=1 Tax=Alkalihalobacillus sp. LMS39 TaxID=2924032 RepID=UPI001FB50E93|nr:DUF4871 domain-containing protein [Alkalihalobacillus sp. LMS39]UOE95254.1 DUF4871 domain-containing protein [Alkalihalobacillus sp. LMS39]